MLSFSKKILLLYTNYLIKQITYVTFINLTNMLFSQTKTTHATWIMMSWWTFVDTCDIVGPVRGIWTLF